MGRKIRKKVKRAPFRMSGNPYLEMDRSLKSIGLAVHLTAHQHVGPLGITDKIDEAIGAIREEPLGVCLRRIAEVVHPHLDSPTVNAEHIIALGAVATWALNIIGLIARNSGCDGEPEDVVGFVRYLADREGLDTRTMNIQREEE